MRAVPRTRVTLNPGEVRIGEAHNPGPQRSKASEGDMIDELACVQAAAWEEPPSGGARRVAVQAPRWERGSEVRIGANGSGVSNSVNGPHRGSTSGTAGGPRPNKVTISLTAALGMEHVESLEAGHALARAAAAWRASWSAWANAMEAVRAGADDAGQRLVESIALQDARTLAKARSEWAKAQRRKEDAQEKCVAHEEDEEEDDPGTVAKEQGDTDAPTKRALDRIRKLIEEGFGNRKHRDEEWLSQLRNAVGEAAMMLKKDRQKGP